MDFLAENWLDRNADRRYPLMDGVSALADDGWGLPNDVLVDLSLYAPATMDPTRFFIRTITAYGTGAVLSIGHGSTGADVATITVVTAGSYQSVVVAAVSGSNVSGRATLKAPTELGTHTFSEAATQILPTLVRADSGGVLTLTIVDRNGVSHPLAGAVTLVAGDNMTLSAAGQTLTMNMTTGVLIDQDTIPDTHGLGRTAIRSINGVSPDALGNIELDGFEGVTVTPSGTGLRISSENGEPCCTATEVESVAEAIETLNQLVGDLAEKSREIEESLKPVETVLRRIGG